MPKNMHTLAKTNAPAAPVSCFKKNGKKYEWKKQTSLDSVQNADSQSKRSNTKEESR